MIRGWGKISGAAAQLRRRGVPLMLCQSPSLARIEDTDTFGHFFWQTSSHFSHHVAGDDCACSEGAQLLHGGSGAALQ